MLFEPHDSTLSIEKMCSPRQVDSHVAEAVRLALSRFASRHFMASQLLPLHDQMQSFRLEFEKLKLQVADTEGLRIQVEDLTAVVEGLKTQAANAEAEMRFLKQSLSVQHNNKVTPLAMLHSARSVLR